MVRRADHPEAPSCPSAVASGGRSTRYIVLYFLAASVQQRPFAPLSYVRRQERRHSACNVQRGQRSFLSGLTAFPEPKPSRKRNRKRFTSLDSTIASPGSRSCAMTCSRL